MANHNIDTRVSNDTEPSELSIELDREPRARFLSPIEPHPMEVGDGLPPLRLASCFDVLVRLAATSVGVTPDEIIGKGRLKPIATARMIVCWIVRRDTKWSYPHIGRLMGKRHHTTIVSACRRVETLQASGDPYTKLLIERIESEALRLRSAT